MNNNKEEEGESRIDFSAILRLVREGGKQEEEEEKVMEDDDEALKSH